MKLKFDPYARTNQLIVDGSIVAISFAAAYLIRFEGFPLWSSTKQFLLWLPYLLAARLLVNWRMGIYRFIWRYVSLSDALAIGRSLTIPTAALLGLRLFYPGWALFANWARIPLSVIALEFLFSLTGSLAARALRRILYERSQRGLLRPVGNPKRIILYGAGRAGLLLLKELENHADVEVVGFIDDNPKKVGTVISGKKVLGSGETLRKIVRECQVDEVVISIATASPKTFREILSRCEEIQLPAKVIPSLQEIVEGRVSISQLREIRIEDLLGRASVETVEIDEEVRRAYSGKRILVTGAGGSIGSELVRQLVPLVPHSIAILDKDENSIYELEQELVFRFPEAHIEPYIADLRYARGLPALMKEFAPQVVFHAAAHKHVPLMEKHPCEAVLNNVGGTKTLLELCRDIRVERFVFISTDKAVNPTSVMGATKWVGERLVQAYANGGSPHSACVRFGNVMGSRGSVIPLFQKQIREGGPLTVTDPQVVRFFMTIPEAVQLVLCAGTLGNRGEVFVLDMGNPRKILDLAEEMVRLSGLEPGKDIEIAITGLRPGEKLVEELVAASEKVCATRFEKVWKVSSKPFPEESVIESAAQLVRTAEENNRKGVCELLNGFGIGFFRETQRLRAPATGD